VSRNLNALFLSRLSWSLCAEFDRSTGVFLLTRCSVMVVASIARLTTLLVNVAVRTMSGDQTAVMSYTETGSPLPSNISLRLININIDVATSFLG
jgi:hypothetical protein